MATNTATVKMIRNIIDGTTPIQSRALFNAAFPVSTIHYRKDAVSPASIYGGSWERIVDKFLYSAGGGCSLGEEGGEAEHVLTLAEMPSHKHYPNEEGYGNLDIRSGGTGWCLMASKDLKNVWGHDVETSVTGGGAAHNNMPPYLAVTAWKRIE